jgi:hypothetical protein
VVSRAVAIGLESAVNDHADASCCPHCGAVNEAGRLRCHNCNRSLLPEPLFAEVARQLNRWERAERWCSIGAMFLGVALVILALGKWGVLAAIGMALAFVLGVIAQRI